MQVPSSQEKLASQKVEPGTTTNRKVKKPQVPCGTFSVMACIKDMFATRPMAVVTMMTAYLGVLSDGVPSSKPCKEVPYGAGRRHVDDDRKVNAKSALRHNGRQGRGHAEDVREEVFHTQLTNS